MRADLRLFRWRGRHHTPSASSSRSLLPTATGTLEPARPASNAINTSQAANAGVMVSKNDGEREPTSTVTAAWRATDDRSLSVTQTTGMRIEKRYPHGSGISTFVSF
jgi:hypothetical protein